MHSSKGKNTGIVPCRQPDSFTLKRRAVYIHLSSIIFQIFCIFPIHFYRTIAINCIIKNQCISIAFRHCDRDVELRKVIVLICDLRKILPRSILYECPVPICIPSHLHRHPLRALGDNLRKVAGDGACSGSGSRSLLLGRLYRRSRRVCGRTRPLRLRGNDHQAHEHHHAHEQGDCSLPKVTFHCLFLLCIYFFRLIPILFSVSRGTAARAVPGEAESTQGVSPCDTPCEALYAALFTEISPCAESGWGCPIRPARPRCSRPRCRPQPAPERSGT